MRQQHEAAQDVESHVHTLALSPEEQEQEGRRMRAREIGATISDEIAKHNLNAPWEKANQDRMILFGVTFEDVRDECQEAFLKAYENQSGVSFSDNVLGYWLEKYGISKERFVEREGVQKTVVKCVEVLLTVDRGMLTNAQEAQVREATAMLRKFYRADFCPVECVRALHAAVNEVGSLYAPADIEKDSYIKLRDAAGMGDEPAFEKN